MLLKRIRICIDYLLTACGPAKGKTLDIELKGLSPPLLKESTHFTL